MRTYTIYHKDFVPEQLFARYPGAMYAEKYYLFGETLFEVAGIDPDELVDLSGLGLQDDDGEEVDILTKAELGDMIDALIASEPTGREIRLSIAQGKHLAETKFKTEDEE